jgi:hypothetical protein
MFSSLSFCSSFLTPCRTTCICICKVEQEVRIFYISPVLLPLNPWGALKGSASGAGVSSLNLIGRQLISIRSYLVEDGGCRAKMAHVKDCSLDMETQWPHVSCPINQWLGSLTGTSTFALQLKSSYIQSQFCDRVIKLGLRDTLSALSALVKAHWFLTRWLDSLAGIPLWMERGLRSAN